jgi:hypothetical protein
MEPTPEVLAKRRKDKELFEKMYKEFEKKIAEARAKAVEEGHEFADKKPPITKEILYSGTYNPLI